MIIAVPLSAISAFAPVMPTRAARKSLRISRRARATCSVTFSRETSRPVASENVSPTCCRLRWIAGITICGGVIRSPGLVDGGTVRLGRNFEASEVAGQVANHTVLGGGQPFAQPLEGFIGGASLRRTVLVEPVVSALSPAALEGEQVPSQLRITDRAPVPLAEARAGRHHPAASTTMR